MAESIPVFGGRHLDIPEWTLPAIIVAVKPNRDLLQDFAESALKLFVKPRLGHFNTS
jgi:hypothetical protein